MTEIMRLTLILGKNDNWAKHLNIGEKWILQGSGTIGFTAYITEKRRDEWAKAGYTKVG